MDAWNDLVNNFYVTFIYENRWRFFLDGFWMTLLLTLSSFLLGSLLGALLCALKASPRKAISKTVTAVNSLLVQLPTMVLLMLFVYIIFGQVPISVVVIVIFGLTLKVSCYMTDIFYTAIHTVDRGEIEAAQTLGLSKLQIGRAHV